MPTREDLLLEKRRYGLEQVISDEEQRKLDLGMPVQKIMGFVELADVKIFLDFNVLIPRYETEELVLKAIKEIPQNSKVLEIGCGSGFISIALKKHRPDLKIVAVDVDNNAVLQTTINAQTNKVDIDIRLSNLFSGVSDMIFQEPFDVIISNPPYLSDLEELPESVEKFEPAIALKAPNDGFFFYKEILSRSTWALKRHGQIYFEINPQHMHIWEELKYAYNLEITKDINGKERFAKIIID